MRIAFVLALLGSVLLSGRISADCIDYGDYLHWVGSVDTPSSALGVAVSGTHAYVADGFSGQQVLDITNPRSPEIVGSVPAPGLASDVVVWGTHVYVTDGSSGLQIAPAQCEPASVGNDHELASKLRLRVFPNPGVHQTTIRFNLPAPGRVRVSVHDAAGRSVRILNDGILGSGAQELSWDGLDERGRQVAAGVYLVRVSAGVGAAFFPQVILR